MATTRTANTHWTGSLMEGEGTVELASSGIGTFPVTWASRAETPQDRTSPEELIAGAHATCYSMALSHALAGAGTPPTSVDTSADVTFQPGEGITEIKLTVRAVIPGVTAEQFAEFAQNAKENCPVSQALAAVKNISLDAELVEG
ncbi:OsmC family peroxiredoxin [Propionibacteriaceae bacterium Y2011]|uniref:OsmC family peroxiredoxin n=1 Tax=Microlunatus sp. Y2014 TaxID=3418488 RepID=UPI003B4D08CB